MDNSFLTQLPALVYGLPFAVTVCDTQGKILYMNQMADKTFNKNGNSLVGANIFDCHPETAINKIRELMASHSSNAYTIEKNGVKKLIYQSPWYNEMNEFAGLIEVSLVIPQEMPHFVRK